MKTDRKAQVPVLSGLYLGYPSPEDSANRLDNWIYDDQTKAWHNHWGIEKFFSNSPVMPGSPTGLVHSLYCYKRHQGAQQFYIFEQGGTIGYVNGSTEAYENLLTGVKPPVQNQPPAQFCEFGPYVICVGGGRFPAFKFRGGQVQPLGWSFKTAEPTAFEPESTLPLIGNEYFKSINSKIYTQGNEMTYEQLDVKCFKNFIRLIYCYHLACTSSIERITKFTKLEKTFSQ